MRKKPGNRNRKDSKYIQKLSKSSLKGDKLDETLKDINIHQEKHNVDNTNLLKQYNDLLLKYEAIKLELEASQVYKKNELELAGQLEDKQIELYNKIASLEGEITKIYSTITYQLGYQLILGFKSFKGFLSLPGNLWEIYRRSKAVKNRRKKEKEAQNKQIILTNPPSIDTKNKQNRVEVKARSDRQWLLENLLLNSDHSKKLKVACIMDDFTFNSYRYECDLHQISRDNWLLDLERIQPEMLFVESAWRGIDEQWYNLINKNVKELQDIINWCRDRGIPTVFWNKEDPIHFQTFLNTAQQFDYVFTTDIDCVPKYREVLGHDSAYFLPFACQPVSNNPIELYERREAFCFAGAYYTKYPERTADLGSIVSALDRYKSVEIYDRNYYKTDPNYMFPENYQPFIVGTLPFEEIDKAYKGYQFAINLNSIKQSQTMFARRVYELLASNTITVSNFSKGVRTLFGDLVFTSDSGEELVKRLENILTNDLAYQKLRLLGLRKVMLEHTYERRLNYITSKVLGQMREESYLPSVTVFALVDTTESAEYIVTQFIQQNYEDKNLILIDIASGTIELPERTNVSIHKLEDIADRKISSITESLYVTLFSPEDYYSINYLLDLALATKYSQAEIIGKSSYYKKEKDKLKLCKGDLYGKASVLNPNVSLVKLSVVSEMTLNKYLKMRSFDFDKMLAIDPFNYCQNGREIIASELEVINDLVVNTGVSLSELIHLSNEFLTKSDKVTKNVSKLVYSPVQIDQLFKSKGRGVIKINSGSGGYVIQSQLDENKHDYIYANEYIDIAHLPKLESGKIYFKCNSKANLDLQCAVLFYNINKKRLNHQIVDINKPLLIHIQNEDVKYIQLGWRIKGSGSALIHQLSFYNLIEGVALQTKHGTDNALLPEKINTIFDTSGSKTIAIDSQDEYRITSVLADNKHEYIYAKNIIPSSDISTLDEIPLYFDVTLGLDIQFVILFLDEHKNRISHQIEYPRTNTIIKPATGTKFFQLGWRVRGAGQATVNSIYFKHQDFDPNVVFGQANVLVLTNNYPSYTDLYKNAFVHSRVKAYKEAGIKTDVFRFLTKSSSVSYHEFEDIDVINGSAKLLDSMLSSGRYNKVLVHFLDQNMWDVLKHHINNIEVITWIHGSDIQPWWRRKFNYEDRTEEELEPVKQASAKKERFWRVLLDRTPENLSFVFVSQQFADEVMQDYGVKLPKNKYHIIHNYIDGNAFKYEEKHPDMRKKILSIRPFTSKTYANDLTVKAILELSKEPWFDELSFTIIGDGVLFDETTAPLKEFRNVRLEKRFLNQQEIIQEHKKHGVFLVPTRMDTQGVSRGEAMSSGLVAITNNVAAIPEFCSDEDTVLVAKNSYKGLCLKIAKLYVDISLYKKISRNGSKRVYNQCGYEKTIYQESLLIKK